MPLRVDHCCLGICTLLTDVLRGQHIPILLRLAYETLSQRYHLGPLRNSNSRCVRGSTLGSLVRSPDPFHHPFVSPLPLE